MKAVLSGADGTRGGWQVGRWQRGGKLRFQSFKEPGNSLVSVCQRSIFLSLFLRQSNQCLSRSPFALMPKETPPGGDKGGAEGWVGAGGESSTPLMHGRHSQHQLLPPRCLSNRLTKVGNRFGIKGW